MLRTPDESAGKKARCPQCGTIADVPTEPDAGAASTSTDPFAGLSPFEPSASTEPDNPFADSPTAGAGITTGAAAPENPYAAPALQEPMVRPQAPLEDTPREGLPWERGKQSVRTFWETTKLVLGSPREAFLVMRRDSGMVTPMLYAIAGGLVGALFSAVYGSLIQLVMFGVMIGTVGDDPEGMAPGAMVALNVVVQFVMALFAGTIGVIIGLFITTAIYHVCLIMLRGANHPFDTTFAVVAYVTGATSLIQIVPVCGQYIYGLVALVYAIIGLSAAQQISGGKAAAAVLLPALVCVVSIALVIGAVIAIVVGSGGF